MGKVRKGVNMSETSNDGNSGGEMMQVSAEKMEVQRRGAGAGISRSGRGTLELQNKGHVMSVKKWANLICVFSLGVNLNEM